MEVDQCTERLDVSHVFTCRCLAAIDLVLDVSGPGFGILPEREGFTQGMAFAPNLRLPTSGGRFLKVAI